MSDFHIPGYDAWKMASPYDDEKECRVCEAVFVGIGKICWDCKEDGHSDGPDPDYARDCMRDDGPPPPFDPEDF